MFTKLEANTVAELDSWERLTIVCRDGLVKWDYSNARWVWHRAPAGLVDGDPVPHEWDFDLVSETWRQK